VASFRKPGPLGMDGATLPASGTLARFPPSPPATIGIDPATFYRSAIGGRFAIGTGAGSSSTDASVQRAGFDTQAEPRRVAQNKAIGALPAKSDDFNFQGRIYRVIRGSDWSQLGHSERYQILPRDEARSLIQAMILKLAVSMAHRTAFQSVLELLGDPNRGPSESGLLLLRAAPTLYVKPPASAAAVTPSQLQALREQSQDTKTHWISIQLVDEAGNPVAGEPYVITTPDSVDVTGSTDESGCARVEGISAGQCQVRFPNRDQDAWKTAAA
jgi:hypothetical protein